MKSLAKILLFFFLIGCGNDIDETTVDRFITIHGEVLNIYNSPIENADVNLYVSHNLSEDIKTNAEGKFEFSIEAEDLDKLVQVQVRKEGFAKALKTVDEYENDVANVFITLRKYKISEDECNGDPTSSNLVTVKGRIVDLNSNPGKGYVTFENNDDQILYSYTDKEGYFEASLKPTTAYSITYNTNCISQKIEQWSTDPLGHAPSEVFKFLDFENSFPEGFQLPEYVILKPLKEFNIIGNVINCNGGLVTNGKIIFSDFWEIPISDGRIDVSFLDCFEVQDSYTYVIEDYDKNARSLVLTSDVVGNTLDLGTVDVCAANEHFININIDNITTPFTEAYMRKNIFNLAEIFFKQDDISYIISTGANGVGDFSSSVEIREEGQADRILYNISEPSILFDNFDFDSFYYMSTGNVSGKYEDIQTNVEYDIQAEFRVATVPDFGEY